MFQSTVSSTALAARPPRRRRSTRAAGLVALGLKLQELDFWAPVRAQVRIPQKRVKYAPTDKLLDVFIAALAGARGLVELNQKLRADPALQAAFGRQGCAEQSVVQETLNACTATTVEQLDHALITLFQRFSHAFRHPYDREWLLLDVDLTGLPCGKKAALATRGYFDGEIRCGRQLGRVLATSYGEIVVDRLFPGHVQLVSTLPELVEAAEFRLELHAARRARTILRVDAGGGTVEQVNWALSRGYHYHGKDYVAVRIHRLAAQVETWYPDPHQPGREFGWVPEHVASPYIRPVRRLVVRSRDPQRPDRRYRYACLLSTVPPEVVLTLLGRPLAERDDPAALARAYGYFYDRRGGMETHFKEDKQGLGITKRNKKRFEAQQVLMLLNQLAHNVLLWAKTWLAGSVRTRRADGPAGPPQRDLTRYGIVRLLRDVFGMRGAVELEAGQITMVILDEAEPLASGLSSAFQGLLASTGTPPFWAKLRALDTEAGGWVASFCLLVLGCERREESCRRVGYAFTGRSRE